MCASVLLLEHCVVTDAGYNWYLHDINICSLSKKIQVGVYKPEAVWMIDNIEQAKLH
jgi:hypothetical protein